MREKIHKALNKIYGIIMMVSFFAGLIPLVPFVVAIIIGGPVGEAIAVFLYKQVYPWIIVLASIAVLVGLVAMYIGKQEGLSVKEIKNK